MKKKKTHDCRSCHKTIIGSAYKFRAHLFSHRLVAARFVCQHCPKEFYLRDQYKLHALKHSATKRLFACDNCGQCFTRKVNLVKHIRNHTTGKRKDYKCGVCGVEYCEYRLLVRHIRRYHFNLEGRQSSHAGKYLNETWVERVLSSDVYVVMTKLTQNAITIKKCTRTESERTNRAKDDGAKDNDRAKDDRAKDNARSKDDARAKDDDRAEDDVRAKDDDRAKDDARAKDNARAKDDDRAKDDTRAKDHDRAEDDDRAKEAKSKAKEPAVLTDSFFDDRNSYFSKAVCNYCNKEMLKKSLVTHIRERHFKMKRFMCEDCGGKFSRRYQMIKHDCERKKQRAKRRGMR